MSREVIDTAAAPADAPPPAGGDETGPERSFWRANRVSLIALPVTLALAAAVYLAVPDRHGLSSLWDLLIHLAPFATAVVTIAYLDVGWAQRLRLHLVLPALCFLVFFTYFVSHNFIYYTLDDFDRLYYNQLMMVPFMILVLALCVRLGGGRRSVVVRLATALIVLQLSGIEDLTFLLFRDLRVEGSQPIPEVWDWADHIAVRLGHHPRKEEAFVFIASHVVLAGLILLVPDRAVRSLRDRVWRRRRATAA